MIVKRNISTFSRILFNSVQNGKGPELTTSKSAEKVEEPKKAAPPPPPPPAPEEPFRNDQYNCPEYFQHNRFSFFELIERMAEKRLPQKSNQESY